MALPATSQMVVDLSGDNDNAGALAAAATIPTVSPDAAFERSCDNPECSAPKLISLVPKKETPEFITEPIIMNQPTLINGFTTVFQIDGTGAKMNDIMYGNNSDAGTSNGAPTTPRSVFRIVPNTHAHIVNYVVVDGAGETMRKIKLNDADTMRKLLDSQRLSAEQMLKKLIGKALIKPPSAKQPEQPVPLPISYQIKSQKPVSIALPNAVPVSGFQLAAGTVVKPIPAPLQEKVLPPIPSGITITQIPSTPPIGSANTAPIPTNTDTTCKSTTPSVSAPVLRNALASQRAEADISSGPSTALKRKLTTTPQPNVIKKLRSRSPKQKTPMAIGLQRPLNDPSPVIKLPTIAKLPTKAPTTAAPLVQSTPLAKKSAENASTSTLNEKNAIEDDDDLIVVTDAPLTATTVNKTTESAAIPEATQSCLASPTSFEESLPATTPKADEKSFPGSDEPVLAKPKPLMGPASRINALRALAAAKSSAAQVSKMDTPNKLSAVLASKTSITKIGETFITSSSAASQKIDARDFPKIKPCTVSIPKVDVPIRTKISDYIQKLNTPSTPNIHAASASKPNVVKLTPGTTTKTDSRRPVFDTPTADKDPLFIGESVPSIKAPAPKTYAKPMTRASLPTKPVLSKAIEESKATKISPKPPTLTTATSKSDAGLHATLSVPATKKISSSPEIMHIKMTRASTPKVGGQLSTKAVVPLPTEPAGSLPTKPAGPLPIKQPGPLPTKLTTVKLPTRPAAVLPTRLSALVNKTSTPSANTGGTSASPALQPKQTKLAVATRKSGVMTIPITAPHPNLKISSVISGGSAVAATLGDDSSSSDMIANESNSGPDIEKLQQELADLRRTVARLTKKKP